MVVRQSRHREERSDAAIQGRPKLDCFASLAMTADNQND
jgi:hypothetical protein